MHNSYVFLSLFVIGGFALIVLGLGLAISTFRSYGTAGLIAVSVSIMVLFSCIAASPMGTFGKLGALWILTVLFIATCSAASAGERADAQRYNRQLAASEVSVA